MRKVCVFNNLAERCQAERLRKFPMRSACCSVQHLNWCQLLCYYPVETDHVLGHASPDPSCPRASCKALAGLAQRNVSEEMQTLILWRLSDFVKPNTGGDRKVGPNVTMFKSESRVMDCTADRSSLRPRSVVRHHSSLAPDS